MIASIKYLLWAVLTSHMWYGLSGSSTPEPLFVSDPTPLLHLTPKQESVCLFLYWCVVIILFNTPFHPLIVLSLVGDRHMNCGINLLR